MRYNVFQMSWNVLDCYLLIIAILSICPLLIGLVPESICTIMSVFTLSVTEVKWPYQSPEWVYSPLDSCKQRPASKAGIFATPICTTGRIISHLADRTTAMYLRLKCLRKVSSLTTHILATDIDIIIQISAVFVKVTGQKDEKTRKSVSQFHSILFCAWNKYAPHSLAPSFSPSTNGMKGAVENVKKRREHLQEKRRALGRSIH